MSSILAFRRWQAAETYRRNKAAAAFSAGPLVAPDVLAELIAAKDIVSIARKAYFREVDMELALGWRWNHALGTLAPTASSADEHPLATDDKKHWYDR